MRIKKAMPRPLFILLLLLFLQIPSWAQEGVQEGIDIEDGQVPLTQEGHPEIILPQFGEEEWHMWYNDELQYHTMSAPPIIEEGILYLPASAILEGLGGTYIFDGGSETYTVFDGDLILAFNMRTGQVITSDERFLSQKVFYRNSEFYLPALFIVPELGGKFYQLSDNTIRITTGGQYLENEELEAVMATMTQYKHTEGGSDTIYLVIRARPSEIDRHLAQLSSRNVRGAFFFTADDIRANPYALRDVYVAGHTVGIYAGGLSASRAVAEIEEASQLMERVLKTTTNIVLAPGGSDEFYSAVTSSGYVVWDANFDSALESETVELGMIANFIYWRSAAYFDGSTTSAYRLGRLLDGMEDMRGRIGVVGEGVSPIRYQ